MIARFSLKKPARITSGLRCDRYRSACRNGRSVDGSAGGVYLVGTIAFDASFCQLSPIRDAISA
jgi:hypothetical protein